MWMTAIIRENTKIACFDHGTCQSASAMCVCVCVCLCCTILIHFVIWDGLYLLPIKHVGMKDGPFGSIWLDDLPIVYNYLYVCIYIYI